VLVVCTLEIHEVTFNKVSL